MSNPEEDGSREEFSKLVSGLSEDDKKRLLKRLKESIEENVEESDEKDSRRPQPKKEDRSARTEFDGGNGPHPEMSGSKAGLQVWEVQDRVYKLQIQESEIALLDKLRIRGPQRMDRNKIPS